MRPLSHPLTLAHYRPANCQVAILSVIFNAFPVAALADEEIVRVRIRREGAAAGVLMRHIIFSRFTPYKPLHVSRYRALALSLDTTPLYGAHTTAADAMAEAVPVISLPSGSWASRVGLSVVLAMGAPQSVSRSLREQQLLTRSLLTDRHVTAPLPRSGAVTSGSHGAGESQQLREHCGPKSWHILALRLRPGMCASRGRLGVLLRNSTHS